LNARDTILAVVSRAPQPDIEPQTPPYQWWNLHDEYGRLAGMPHKT